MVDTLCNKHHEAVVIYDSDFEKACPLCNAEKEIKELKQSLALVYDREANGP